MGSTWISTQAVEGRRIKRIFQRVPTHPVGMKSYKCALEFAMIYNKLNSLIHSSGNPFSMICFNIMHKSAEGGNQDSCIGRAESSIEALLTMCAHNEGMFVPGNSNNINAHTP